MILKVYIFLPRQDVHQSLLHYHIADSSSSLANLFGEMEQSKGPYYIEDYSVSQTTLDEVFINFARAQIPPQEDMPSTCRRLFPHMFQCSCCCNSQVKDEEDESLLSEATVLAV